jgi:transcriptional regulator with XRE-family HTH domain
MDLIQLFGRNIRAFREQRGLTQEQLALEAGMKRSYVSELERGLRNPTVRALGRLASALGIDPAELLKSAGKLG